MIHFCGLAHCHLHCIIFLFLGARNKQWCSRRRPATSLRRMGFQLFCPSTCSLPPLWSLGSSVFSPWWSISCPSQRHRPWCPDPSAIASEQSLLHCPAPSNCNVSSALNIIYLPLVAPSESSSESCPYQEWQCQICRWSVLRTACSKINT